MEQYTILGATVVISMGVLELIKYAIGKIGNQNKQSSEELLTRISTNELQHIQLGLTHMVDQHDKMIEILCEISGKLSK